MWQGALVSGIADAASKFVNDAWMVKSYYDQKDEARLFAKNSLGWRIEDAVRHGIHPLAAVGVQPAQHSPQMIGSLSNDPIGGIGDALMQRARDKENKELKIEQLALLKAQRESAEAQAIMDQADARDRINNAGKAPAIDGQGIINPSVGITEQNLGTSSPWQISPKEAHSFPGISYGTEPMEKTKIIGNKVLFMPQDSQDVEENPIVFTQYYWEKFKMSMKNAWVHTKPSSNDAAVARNELRKIRDTITGYNKKTHVVLFSPISGWKIEKKNEYNHNQFYYEATYLKKFRGYSY